MESKRRRDSLDDELKEVGQEVMELLRRDKEESARNEIEIRREKKRQKKLQQKRKVDSLSDTDDIEQAASSETLVKPNEIDKEGQPVWNITGKRKVKIQKFKGKKRVDIREYYQGDSGDMLPGKKGISLSMEEYQSLKKLIKSIDKHLKEP